MRVVVVYKDRTDTTRDVETFLRDFKHQTGRDLETINPESLPGIDFCRAYDIVEYPSVVAISDEGHMQNLWRGVPLPMISEVSYYV
jgi:hypothetical protein